MFSIHRQISYIQYIEQQLMRILQELNLYYIKNQLRQNPDKTQICSFHLRNHELKKQLEVGEYFYPLWKIILKTYQTRQWSHHSMKPLGSRVITVGCFKPLPLKSICLLVGIAPPGIRRQTITYIERSK